MNSIRAVFPGIAALFLASAAFAQGYPAKVVRILTAEAGAGGDFSARLLANGLTPLLGQPVIVENRGGLLPIDTVAKAKPDGYTLLLMGSTIWIAPLMQKTSYDPAVDLAPVTLVATSTNILAAHPSLPVKSVKELVALAKASPGELNYGSGAAGSSSQMATELFKSMAGVNIVQVRYRGNGPAMLALTSGEIQVMIGNVNLVTPHRAAKRVRALAVTSAEPSKLAPDLPTVAATVRGYESLAKWVVFAPAGTPAAIVARLNQEAVRVLRAADVKEKLLNSGVEAVGSTPEELAADMRRETAQLARVISQAGLRTE